MSLRIYHLDEQLQRSDVSPEHYASVEAKFNRCLQQQADLMEATQRLVHDIFAGKTRHRTYRQHKMYNDPSLNPQIYTAQQRRVA
jgi:transcriptional accessory protein Tex/SPT6